MSIDPKQSLSYEQAHTCAAERGCTIRHPLPNELFVDIDSFEDYEAFWRSLEIFKQYFDVLEIVETPSKSGGDCKHIVVTLKVPLEPLERIALQAALGSDRKREMLSFVSHKTGATSWPTLFFEKTG